VAAVRFVHAPLYCSIERQRLAGFCQILNNSCRSN
jgi:hypothetical protein